MRIRIHPALIAAALIVASSVSSTAQQPCIGGASPSFGTLRQMLSDLHGSTRAVRFGTETHLDEEPGLTHGSVVANYAETEFDGRVARERRFEQDSVPAGATIVDGVLGEEDSRPAVDQSGALVLVGRLLATDARRAHPDSVALWIDVGNGDAMRSIPVRIRDLARRHPSESFEQYQTVSICIERELSASIRVRYTGNASIALHSLVRATATELQRGDHAEDRASMFPADEIEPSDNAVLLRSIWSRRGNGEGTAVAAFRDIDGDGRDDFGVLSRKDLKWRIYGLDEVGASRVLWQGDAQSPMPIRAANFFGDGRRTFLHPREVDTLNDLGRSATYFYGHFHDLGSGQIEDTPFAIWTSWEEEGYQGGVQFFAEDLDLDGDDEFIVASTAEWRSGTTTFNGRITIYAGGPDFQIHTPTVVIRETKYNANEYFLHLGRIDDDAYPDLIVVTGMGGRIRWGGANLAALDRPIDREFEPPHRLLKLLDADGDDRHDLFWIGGYMHLSSSGKDQRNRAFDNDDADRRFGDINRKPVVYGPLNDSTDRYDMFGVNSAKGDDIEWVFSGAYAGPDSRYDAYYSTGLDGLGYDNPMLAETPLGDVDGNGWRDFLGGNHQFLSDLGVAFVIGGGPHIPRDSMLVSGIGELPGDHAVAFMSVWPRPAREIVHITWKVDREHVPDNFAAYDPSGRLVARGRVEPGREHMSWHCDDQPAGAYLLLVFDARGNRIASEIVPVR
jgi:hypothetical protein